MFARSQPATEHADGGLGVGLTLAKRLVELHGGAISAHSDGIGRGSEFVVRLPARQAELAQTQPVAAPHARDAPSGLRIVIVDDNRDSAESLQLMLELMGNEVRTGHDGAEAVELVEAFRPHAVLLDIGLPVISGYEAAKRIRALAGSERCMLIAITGWGQDSDRERSREAGFDHHLVKPVDAAQLLGILGAAQPRARAARPSAKKKHRHPHATEQPPRGEARGPASAPKPLTTGKAR
jgi:CheY-like chemotaxis protein